MLNIETYQEENLTIGNWWNALRFSDIFRLRFWYFQSSLYQKILLFPVSACVQTGQKVKGSVETTPQFEKTSGIIRFDSIIRPWQYEYTKLSKSVFLKHHMGLIRSLFVLKWFIAMKKLCATFCLNPRLGWWKDIKCYNLFDYILLAGILGDTHTSMR